MRKPLGPKHEIKRAAILQKAAQLFAQNGYETTSLDMIADHLGIHKATLYHYVPNKETILYECLLASFEDLDQVIEAMHDKSTPLLDRFRHFVRALARAQNNDFGRCLVLVGERPLDMVPGGKIRAFQRRLDVALRDLTMEGVLGGQLRPVDPSLVAAMLFGALNWVPRWFRPGKRLSVEDVADAFVDMLAQGITPR
ncbi:MAG: TetR/AcrR family transcriptional regulator [Bradyrhizobium sp.]